MRKLTVLKLSRGSGKPYSQLAFLINDMLFDYKTKRELLQQIEKVRLS